MPTPPAGGRGVGAPRPPPPTPPPAPPGGGWGGGPGGTARPPGWPVSTGRAYVGPPDPPFPVFAALPVPSPAPARRPRSPLGTALFTCPSPPPAVPADDPRGAAAPALP